MIKQQKILTRQNALRQNARACVNNCILTYRLLYDEPNVRCDYPLTHAIAFIKD